MTARGWRRFFRVGRGPRRIAEEVDSELSFHLEMRTQKLIARGEAPADAQQQALRRFGDLPAVRSELLDIDRDTARRRGRLMVLDELRQDTAYALRAIRHQPGFATVVLLTLALGIGANTAIFSLVDALLLRHLPVLHADELVAIGDRGRVNSASEDTSPRGDLFSYPTYTSLVADGGTVGGAFTGVVATGRSGALDVVVRDPVAPTGAPPLPHHPRGRLVSGNYFAVLGVHAAIGRTLTPDDDRVAGGAPVVVVSHRYWETRLGSTPRPLGTTLTVNGSPFTVVGVLPPEFTGEIVGQPLDLWIPVTMQPVVMKHRDWLGARENMWLLLLARRAPGVSFAEARTRVLVRLMQILTDQSRAVGDSSAVAQARRLVIPVASGANGFSRLRVLYADSIVTLMVAVGLVLLIICANLANLMLARSAARQREIGVRMALGAGRRRLLRQLLTESLVLAGTGAALGLVIAWWGTRLLLRLASTGIAPIPLDAGLGAPVLLFTAGVAALTAVLFGTVPALGATRLDLATTLRAHGRGLDAGIWGTSRRRLGLGKWLVVAQVGLSLALVVSTSLLVRSLRALQQSDVGLARDQLLVIDLDPAASGYADARYLALGRDLTGRLSALPGVEAVTLSENGLFSGTESSVSVQVPGFAGRSAEDSVVYWDQVGPAYFGAVGARLVRGRDIAMTDATPGATVAVVNETMARFYFPGADPVGRTIRVDSTTLSIVGVVQDITDHNLHAKPSRRLYSAFLQARSTPSALSLIVRTRGAPARLGEEARRVVLAADPALTVIDIGALGSRMTFSIAQDRLVTQVITFFGVLALGLAAVGLYGVMAYATVRRTGEFGLRLALGAAPGVVARMVMRETLAVVVIGIVMGVPAAYAGARLLQHQLFGVGPTDLFSLVAALVVLVCVALAAGYLPARRASRVGPLTALRSE